MDEDYTDYSDLTDHQRRNRIYAVIVAFCVLSVSLVAYQVYLAVKPVDLSANLSKVDSATAKKAAEQLTIPIANMPLTIEPSVQQKIEQYLAYMLRQKYGSSASHLTATARQINGWNGDNTYRLYVDIQEKHETYAVDINTINNTFSITCAPNDKQMGGSDHTCTDLPGVDEYNFPNG